ncbi:heterogeneous nuclear ribonucleoprotein A3-like [Littorina saxatilis]|uniref:RRM domain-containing protein n=1 Tax=Littorina saxatilis TaxID=31220 RepID=A0AAN9G2A6_9CAEN
MPFHQNYGPGPRPNRSRYDDPSNPNSEQFRKLFIGGLSYETDEKGLKGHFETYGEITDCIVMRDPQTKRSRGFGFITYKEAPQLDEAQKNRPHKIDGREVETKRAMPRDDPSNQQSVTKMFIGGLKDDTTEEMIREVFPGKIEMVEMIKDKTTGKSRGFCFVTFDDYDTVDKHVLKRHFDLNGRRVEVKKAVSKNEMIGGYSGGGRGGYGGRGEMGYGPGYGMGGGMGYGPGPSRGGYGGGNYGGPGSYGSGGYANQGGWNQGGYADYGYNNQGGGWGGPNYNYSGPMKG